MSMYYDGHGIALRDTTRDLHPAPCGDCGREHLQGEHIAFNVPTSEQGGTRKVWEGCVDCWLRRTDPTLP